MMIIKNISSFLLLLFTFPTLLHGMDRQQENTIHVQSESLFARPIECRLFLRHNSKCKSSLDKELHESRVYGPISQDVINKHNIAMDRVKSKSSRG